MDAIYPTGGEDNPEAVPAVYREPDGMAEGTTFTLEVDAEVFAVRPDRFGGTAYTWLTGPNPGYGFGQSPTPDSSPEAHRKNIHNFLAQIDPRTGYLEDD